VSILIGALIKKADSKIFSHYRPVNSFFFFFHEFNSWSSGQYNKLYLIFFNRFLWMFLGSAISITYLSKSLISPLPSQMQYKWFSV